jgi:CRISPR system Cascade subunit CasA
LKGAQGGIGYRHWEALVLKESGSTTSRPARVVEDFLETKHRTLNRVGTFSRQVRLWVFGYDMKQNKPRCWYSTQMPLIAVPEERQDTFLYSVRQMTQAARAAAWQTRTAVKSAWFSNSADAKGDLTFIEQRFWEATTVDFYACLASIADGLEAGAPDPIVVVAERWWRAVSSTARGNFDDLALSGDSAALDLKRVIRARNRLGKWLASGREMKQLRQLANPEDAA